MRNASLVQPPLGRQIGERPVVFVGLGLELGHVLQRVAVIDDVRRLHRADEDQAFGERPGHPRADLRLVRGARFGALEGGRATAESSGWYRSRP